MKYEVDIKAFINIEVIANSPDEARRAAEAFVENCLSATRDTVIGYNQGLPDDAVGRIGPAEYEFAIDGESEVEEVDEPDDRDVPDDTPSLDTSFHDHEMDID